jgi:hypothetical protein
MREDQVKGLGPSNFGNARIHALHRSVSIDERSSPLPAAVDTPVQAENRDEATSGQAVEFDVWEDEGGTPAVDPLEFPGRHAKRPFDELSG